MIKTQKGDILRNLEEQVQYLTDYHKTNQGIAQWGIRVVGQVSTASDLPDAATYEGEFGDTYAVGTEAPYDFYIWTRSSIVGEPGYWFPFGEISIVGPQGPAGKDGEKGDTGASTKWHVINTYPSSDTSDYYKDKDMAILLNPALSANGNVYQYLKPGGVAVGLWTLNGNIRGPQGIQGIQGIQGPAGPAGTPGPKGEKGDVGGFINIWGTLENTEQLPTPASLDNLTAAYLIHHTGGTDQANDHYDLYIQVGENSDEAVWVNAGPFNAATLVTVGGVGQNVWDADTKLDKNTAVGQGYVCYSRDHEGNQTLVNYTTTANGYCLIQRTGDGNFYMPEASTMTNPYHAVSKQYVDGVAATKLDTHSDVTEYNQLYAKAAEGYQASINVTKQTLADAVVQRQSDGNILVPLTPAAAEDAVSKQYADTKLTAPTPSDGFATPRIIGYDVNLNPSTFLTHGTYIFSTEYGFTVVPMYKKAGKAFAQTEEQLASVPNTIFVAEPQLDYEAANKKYVDTRSSLYRHRIGVGIAINDSEYLVYINFVSKENKAYTKTEFLAEFAGAESPAEFNAMGANKFNTDIDVFACQLTMSSGGMYTILYLRDNTNGNMAKINGNCTINTFEPETPIKLKD